MKGRRIPLLVGVLTLVGVVVVIVAVWPWAAESWYLWRLKSEDEAVRKRALAGLANVATVRSIPALIEIIQTDLNETLFVKDDNSEAFHVTVEIEEKYVRKGGSKFCDYEDARIEGCGTTTVFCTPATFALYRVGKPALPTIRETWHEQKNFRAMWVLSPEYSWNGEQERIKNPFQVVIPV